LNDDSPPIKRAGTLLPISNVPNIYHQNPLETEPAARRDIRGRCS
jgi:hypothetical protein